jgi:hypothetical protein
VVLEAPEAPEALVVRQLALVPVALVPVVALAVALVV